MQTPSPNPPSPLSFKRNLLRIGVLVFAVDLALFQVFQFLGYVSTECLFSVRESSCAHCSGGGAPDEPEITSYFKDELCGSCRFTKANEQNVTCGFLVDHYRRVDQSLSYVQAYQMVADKYPTELGCQLCQQLNETSNAEACRAATVMTEEYNCGFLINIAMAETPGLSLLQAAKAVASRYPKTCNGCLPQNCDERQKLYWRYDQVAPKELGAQTLPWLPSIPARSRLPAKALADETALENYLEVFENQWPQRHYMFDFNPSLVVLPKDQRPIINGRSAMYLATLRIDTYHNCFIEPFTRDLSKNWPPRASSQLLGVALLDENLDIISDAAVSKDGLKMGKEDFRLFELHGQVYLSGRHRLTPIWLVPPTSGLQTLPNTHGDLTIYLGSTVESLKTIGKNLNYFIDRENRTLVEFWPVNDREVFQVDLDDTSKPNERFFTEGAPEPSFATQEQLHYFNTGHSMRHFSEERGSACCVEIPNPSDGVSPDSLNPTLLVGLSHSKIPRIKESTEHMRIPENVTRFTYFYRFYAFEPSPPYRVVALSGIFCFGGARPAEYGSNELAHVDWQEKIRVGEDMTSCPRIQFVMSMIEKANDPSRVLISYGVNDCYSRILEISKSEITRMLFDPSKTELSFE